MCHNTHRRTPSGGDELMCVTTRTDAHLLGTHLQLLYYLWSINVHLSLLNGTNELLWWVGGVGKVIFVSNQTTVEVVLC